MKVCLREALFETLEAFKTKVALILKARGSQKVYRTKNIRQRILNKLYRTKDRRLKYMYKR